jgi:hypothetical protein
MERTKDGGGDGENEGWRWIKTDGRQKKIVVKGGGGGVIGVREELSKRYTHTPW